MTNPLQTLRNAIAEFDKGAAERNAAWDKIETEQDLKKCESDDLAALEKVQEAFWQATKDRNSRENCKFVGMDFMRQISQLKSL